MAAFKPTFRLPSEYEESNLGCQTPSLARYHYATLRRCGSKLGIVPAGRVSHPPATVEIANLASECRDSNPVHLLPKQARSPLRYIP